MDYPEPPLSPELELDLPAGTRWALVLSHDIDHLGLREHITDGFLLRFALSIVRQEVLHRFRPGRAAAALGGLVLSGIGHDRWDVVGDLLEAERRAGVRSTWFVAMREGLGISYERRAAEAAIRAIRDAGHEVGLHGQSHESAAAYAAEAHELASILGAPVPGGRMHYLRLTPETLDGMVRAGLRYDSTVFERKRLHPDTHPLAAPRLVRPGLVEIPLHVMDATLFSTAGLGLDLAGARDYVRRLAQRAADLRRALVVNLHPNFYSTLSPDARDWYDALLGDLTARSDVFVTDFAGLVPRIVGMP